jgi:hypothetical protein
VREVFRVEPKLERQAARGIGARQREIAPAAAILVKGVAGAFAQIAMKADPRLDVNRSPASAPSVTSNTPSQ